MESHHLYGLICIRSIIIKKQHLRQRFSTFFLQSDICSLQFIFLNFAPPWRKVHKMIPHHGVSIEGLCCLTRLARLYLIINVPLGEFLPSTYISICFTKMFGFSTYFFKKFIVPFSILFFHLSMLYWLYNINRCSEERC